MFWMGEKGLQACGGYLEASNERKYTLRSCERDKRQETTTMPFDELKQVGRK